MNRNHQLNICKGCGGTISPDDDVVEIKSGKVFNIPGEETPGFAGDKRWGRMHASCFLIAVGDPDAIFAIEPATAA